MNSMQVKDKLKNIAKKRNVDFNILLRLYMYDRFIERLAASKYKDNFILKGGFYLSTLFGLENRSTKDIDTAIINENQVIVVEDLDVKKMFQTKRIAKVLGDISISKFINMLEYKTRWYGRKLIKVNRYYPSSQLCNCCGYRNKELKDYSIRVWNCPSCDNFHNRDFNAANNILDKGLELLFV